MEKIKKADWMGINRIIMEFKLLYQGNFLHLQLTGINRIIMEFK